MPPFVEALRPHQWVKNLLVLFPLFFTNRAFELAGWTAAMTGAQTFNTTLESPNMVFTLGPFGHTFALLQWALALVQSP